ncbi:MAG: helix-turn-helix transcriptional regulator [Phaeodactylibacter sp.]|nr:helix-turn-helix transcriptional regulator [Phaeodactylibacter sp.]
MITIPQRLLEDDLVRVLLSDGQSHLLQKSMRVAVTDRKAYLALPVLNLVRSGRQVIRDYDGRTWYLEAGEVAFLPRGLYTLNDLLPDSGAYESLLFFMAPKTIHAFLNQIDWRPKAVDPEAPRFFKAKLNAPLRLFYEQLPTLARAMQGESGAYLQLKIQEVLHLLNQHEQGAAFRQALLHMDLNPKRNLPQFMQNHFHHAFTLEDYAALTGRSLSTFRRDFKRYFQVSPHHWLRQERMGKARQLLLEQEELRIYETAHAVGYENVSHFIKAFKQVYGQTPGEWRTQQ